MDSRPRTRFRLSADNFKVTCLFYDKEDDRAHLTQAQTFDLDKKVRNCATELCDEKLLAMLAEGDMIAVEALYHKTCLISLYNRLREIKDSKSIKDSEDEIIEGIVLTEIIDYLKDSCEFSDSMPIFKL